MEIKKKWKWRNEWRGRKKEGRNEEEKRISKG